MATNFNIVKKPKKDDEDDFLDEDEAAEEEKKSSAMDKKVKTRMLLFMGIVLGGIVVLLLVLYIISLLSSHNYSYDQIEEVLKNAAISYFKDYPESLPLNNGDIVDIDSSNLVVAGKMKDLSEYTGEGVLCSGTVQVRKSNDSYSYVPFLNCGDAYTTFSLSQKIIESGTVTSGYGLYSINNSYIYRGETVNNYLQLEKSLWRIVRITSDNELVLIHDTGIPYSSRAWDNRYNNIVKNSTGFNNYFNSRMYEYLQSVYNNHKEGDYENLLSENDLVKTTSFSLCTGKRADNSQGFNNSEECSELLPDQKYGLLTISDYMVASIDSNCTTPLSKSCVNYNYLSKVKNWWLVTANKADSEHVYAVGSNGYIVSDLASSMHTVRPIVYLSSNVLYKDGDGSLENPYTVK